MQTKPQSQAKREQNRPRQWQRRGKYTSEGYAGVARSPFCVLKTK
mgnify:CR=1